MHHRVSGIFSEFCHVYNVYETDSDKSMWASNTWYLSVHTNIHGNSRKWSHYYFQAAKDVLRKLPSITENRRKSQDRLRAHHAQFDFEWMCVRLGICSCDWWTRSLPYAMPSIFRLWFAICEELGRFSVLETHSRFGQSIRCDKWAAETTNDWAPIQLNILFFPKWN